MLGWLNTAAGHIPQVTSKWQMRDYLWAGMVRLGFGRDHYRISPGLYALGQPDTKSPVVVTCNFKLTFDILRRELSGHSFWVLVVETYGINVWCAAGKKSFSTEEVARRVKESGLDRVVSHRTLILPQLAGPGVAAFRLRKICGFSGIFGPVHIRDLPAYLDAGQKANLEMRSVDFPLGQRLLVALVEMYGARKFLLWVLLGCLFLALLGPAGLHPVKALTSGLAAFASVVTGFLTGVFLVPALLRRIPMRAFAAKGLLIGAVSGVLPAAFLAGSWSQAFVHIMVCSAFASWFAMHYTGSTPFTSLSGVDREMRRFIPFQGGLLVMSIMFWLLSSWL